MKERRQLTIGIHRDKYEFLSGRKGTLEEALGRRINWGTYLMILASQRPLDESVAIFHDAYDDEANPEDYEEIPSWVTREEVEEIVSKAAERIIRELSKLLPQYYQGLIEGYPSNDQNAPHKVYPNDCPGNRHINDCQSNLNIDIHKTSLGPMNNMNNR
jgi:hypothetical protein